VVIADTAKGRGVSFMAARSCARRGYRWHGGAPSLPEYLDALTELGQGVTDVETSEALRGFVERQRLVEAAPAIAPAGGLSTGAAFAAALRPLMTKHRDLVVLDADLEHACRLTEVAKRFPKRFVEMGISEADMVSCAGGLALGGKLPVVNTYAAFFRRAYEQIYVNATEETRIIYAGHYAGLCYATDGKTHQCTGDVAMMRAIPGMTVLYPAFPEEISGMLEWYLDSDHQGPLYLRLHRTPAAEVKLAEPARFVPGWGVTIRSRESPTVILTSGPHMVAACTDVADETGIDLIAISTLRGLSAERVSELIERYDELLIIEELIEAGGLLDELSRVIASLCSSRRPAMRHLAVDGFTCSTLEPDGLYRRFGLDREALSHWVRAGFGV
jgi:transketolase